MSNVILFDLFINIVRDDVTSHVDDQRAADGLEI